MNVNRIIFLVFFSLLLSSVAFGYSKSGTSPSATYTTDGSWSDVQAAIDNATGGTDWRYGDTIEIPNGTYDWTSYIDIAKGVTIQGAGSSSTRIRSTNSNQLFRITGSQGPRITGIEWYMNTGSPDYLNAMTGAAQNFRIDNCKFTRDVVTDLENSTAALLVNTSESVGQPKGVIDHNEFRNLRIYISSPSTLCTLDWMASASKLGSADNIFYEDNYTWRNGGGRNYLDLQNGTSVVDRFNLVEGPYFLNHVAGTGDCPRRSGRYWEIYGNEYIFVPGANNRVIDVQGGTGVIFNNIFDSDFPTPNPQLGIYDKRKGSCNGTSPADMNEGSGSNAGWPCRDNIGRATDLFEWAVAGTVPDQADEPAYLWGNTHDAVIKTSTDEPYVVKRRDYYEDSAGGGVTSGLWANRPVTCTDNDGYWATDKGGNWNTSNGTSNDGALYVCTSNAWGNRDGTTDALGTYTAYVPYTYPHPLTLSEDGETPASGGRAKITQSAGRARIVQSAGGMTIQ